MSKINVYKEYQLAQFNGVFDTNLKKVIRDRAVVTDAYANEINANYKDNGRFFELDKEASEKYHEESKLHNEKRAKSKELKKVADGNILADIISSAVKSVTEPKEEKRGRKPKENESELQTKMEELD